MNPSQSKIVSRLEALTLVKQWQADNLKVVFTNGCFDILHLGHIDYLEKARALGDKLILGLNADESVKRLKGNSRPINQFNARARMLAAMQFVDAIVPFDENTPLSLITYLLPDVLVKGKDYEISNIVGADIVLKNGGTVETIEFVVGYSTTTIIEKLKLS